MKVTVEHPMYPVPIYYDNRLLRWIVRCAAGNATMADAVAAQEALKEAPVFPVCLALQATMDVSNGMVDQTVAQTVFHVDLDADGVVDLTIDDVGEFVRYVTGKSAGELKKESVQYQKIVRNMAKMIE